MQRTASRVTDRFERKREAILDAATVLLNKNGVKGLTLGEAAAAVGLSTTSVTYYFKRKDDLAAACMLRGVSALQKMVDEALLRPTPRERLHRLLELYVGRLRQTTVGEAPPLPSLADLRALNMPALGVLFQAYMKLFRAVRQIFEAPELAELSRGRRTARTHLLLEQIFWAGAWFSAYGPDDYDRLRERMYDLLAEGFATPGAVWAPHPISPAQLAPAAEDAARETFLHAATKLINARGYRGASVDKISAELNVTKGSFYHHNEAKDDLVVACFERTFEVMRRAQKLALESPGDQWRRLSTFAAAISEYQLSEHGPLLRISGLGALPEGIRGQMVAEWQKISGGLSAMVSDGIAEGSIRPVDPPVAAVMLTATLNAGAELAFWVPGVKQKAAPAIFARPLLMGLFSR